MFRFPNLWCALLGLRKIKCIMEVQYNKVLEGHCNSHYWPQGGSNSVPVCYHCTKSNTRGSSSSNSSSVSTRFGSLPDLESVCTIMLNWLKMGKLEGGIHKVDFIRYDGRKEQKRNFPPAAGTVCMWQCSSCFWDCICCSLVEGKKCFGLWE